MQGHTIESRINFIGQSSKSKYDVVNNYNGWFQYSKESVDIIFHGIDITQKIYKDKYIPNNITDLL